MTFPDSWAVSTIGDALINHDKQRIPLKASDRSKRHGEYPYYGASGVIDHIDNYLFDGEHLLVAEDGANLLSRSTPIAFRAQGKFWVNNHAHVLTTPEGIELRFVENYINSISLAPYVTGTAQPKVTQSALGRIELPLPPLAEQRRIVAKLDRLSARSTAARDHLARIPKLATRAKQALLAAAFRGEMTRDWRVSSSSEESSDEFVSLLGNQRKALSEQSGNPRSRRITSSAHPRIPVNLEGLSHSWRTTTLEELTNPLRLIQYGILKPGQDVVDGVPYVKVLNIKKGRIELEKIRRTTREIHGSYMRSSLKSGDLLLSIRGTVGRLGFVPEELDGGNITQDSVRIDILPEVNPRFIYWYLHSPFAQTYFAVNMKGMAVRGINVGDVRPMEVPITNRPEQDEVVRRIDLAFAHIDRLAAEAMHACHLLDRLDEQLLAKAFRGDLVPQDPANEPAEALLARIREARAAAPKPKRGRRRKTEAAA
ncbi:MAG: restriction endonuclease subunit S [Geminicoccaceae bacterium]